MGSNMEMDMISLRDIHWEIIHLVHNLELRLADQLGRLVFL